MPGIEIFSNLQVVSLPSKSEREVRSRNLFDGMPCATPSKPLRSKKFLIRMAKLLYILTEKLSL